VVGYSWRPKNYSQENISQVAAPFLLAFARRWKEVVVEDFSETFGRVFKKSVEGGVRIEGWPPEGKGTPAVDIWKE